MLNQQLLKILSVVLKINVESITPDTSTENTASWDSAAHLELILDIEETFGVRFRSDDIPELTSVRALQQALERHGIN